MSQLNSIYFGFITGISEVPHNLWGSMLEMVAKRMDDFLCISRFRHTGLGIKAIKNTPDESVEDGHMSILSEERKD